MSIGKQNIQVQKQGLVSFSVQHIEVNLCSAQPPTPYTHSRCHDVEADFWWAYSRVDRPSKNFYEVIRENSPSKLYFDLEFEWVASSPKFARALRVTTDPSDTCTAGAGTRSTPNSSPTKPRMRWSRR